VIDRSEERLTLSVDEAAHLPGVSSALVYGLVHRGELTAIRLGRLISAERSYEASLRRERMSPMASAAWQSLAGSAWA
jgi:excisionase family DNA binding protein